MGRESSIDRRELERDAAFLAEGEFGDGDGARRRGVRVRWASPELGAREICNKGGIFMDEVGDPGVFWGRFWVKRMESSAIDLFSAVILILAIVSNRRH